MRWDGGRREGYVLDCRGKDRKARVVLWRYHDKLEYGPVVGSEVTSNVCNCHIPPTTFFAILSTVINPKVYDYCMVGP